MLKKTILMIAVVSLMAMPVFGKTGYLDGKKIEAGMWPTKYIPQPITTQVIPVYMNIGYYVEVKDIQNIKVYLNQIDFNTYEGSTKFKIKANFEALIGSEIEDLGKVPYDAAKVKGGFTTWVGDDSGDGADEVIPAGDSWNELELFAKVDLVKMAKVEGSPDCKLHVADITLTVVPTASPPAAICPANPEL